MENAAVDEERFMDAYRMAKKRFKRKHSFEEREAFAVAWVLYYWYFIEGDRSALVLERMQALIETTGARVPKKKHVTCVVTCPHCGKELL